MASGIRFTKPERQLLRDLLDHVGPLGPLAGIYDMKAMAAASCIRHKLDASEQPKAASGLAVGEAITAFREVLGNRLVVPPSPSAGWYAQLGRELANTGITRLQCTQIAKTADATWRMKFIKAESLIRQAQLLLAEAQQDLTFESADFNATTMEDL